MALLLHIWSIETMQLLVLDPELPKLINGAWSPQGDVYAAITQQENNERFLLIIVKLTHRTISG